MKKLLLFLAVASLASATAITLNTLTALGDSNLINAPADTFTPVGSTSVTATVGGLCSGAVGSCPSSGSGITPTQLTFTLASPSMLSIFLQDQDSVGDIYEVILSNGSTTWDYYSNIVSLGGSASQSCWNSSIGFTTAANSCLSTTPAAFAAGNYTIDVWDVILSYVGATDPFPGGGTVPLNPVQGANGTYSPAAFQLEVNATPILAPEPASFALLGLGGIALGLLRRRIAK